MQNTLLVENKINFLIQQSKKLLLCFLCCFMIFSIVSAIPAQGLDFSINVKDASGNVTETITRENFKSGVGAFAFYLSYLETGEGIKDISDSNVIHFDGHLTIAGTSYRGIIKNIYDGFVTVGTVLAIIWVLMETIEKAEMSQINGETILRLGIKLVVALWIMTAGFDFFLRLVDFGDAIREQVSQTSSPGANAASILEFKKMYENASWIQCLGDVLATFVTGLAMGVAAIYMKLTMWGRNLEIMIRLCFMPIGVSDFMTHGMHSPGFRYLKKFVAVCSQSAVLTLILYLGTMLMNTTVGSGWPIVVAFTMVGLMMRSQQIVSEIFGA